MKLLNTSRSLAASAVMAGMFMLSSCSLLPQEKEVLQPPLIQPEQHSTYVTEMVKRGDLIRKIDAVGVLDPSEVEYYEVSQTGARLSDMKVKAGDVVKKGDLIVQLNADGLDLELKQRQLDLAKKRLAYDDAKLIEDERHLEVRKMEIAIAQMLVNETEQKIISSRLLAKKDGIVTFVTNSKPGDVIEKFVPLVATADPNALRIALTPSDSNAIQEVKLGMEAELTYNGTTYKSKVVQTPASAPATSNSEKAKQDQKTIYLTAEGTLDRPQIGQGVTVIIRLASKNNVLSVPLRAIRTNGDRKVVQVLDGERIQEFNVNTGLETATDVEIIDGLKEGQKVVLR